MRPCIAVHCVVVDKRNALISTFSIHKINRKSEYSCSCTGYQRRIKRRRQIKMCRNIEQYMYLKTIFDANTKKMCTESLQLFDFCDGICRTTLNAYEHGLDSQVACMRKIRHEFLHIAVVIAKYTEPLHVHEYLAPKVCVCIGMREPYYECLYTFL